MFRHTSVRLWRQCPAPIHLIPSRTLAIQPTQARLTAAVSRGVKRAACVSLRPIARKLATAAKPAVTGDKAKAEPVGMVRLFFTNTYNSWKKLSYDERMQRLNRYVIVTGVAFTGFVVFKIFTDTASFLVNLTNRQVFMAGMTTGAILSGVTILSAFSVRRMFQIRPEPLYRHVLKFLNRDERVVTALGKPLKTGKFRAYRYDRKSIGDRIGNRTLQLMFEVVGKHHEASVSVEVAKTWRGKYEFGLLAVDVHGTGDRIVLSGDASRSLNDVTLNAKILNKSPRKH